MLLLFFWDQADADIAVSDDLTLTDTLDVLVTRAPSYAGAEAHARYQANTHTAHAAGARVRHQGGAATVHAARAAGLHQANVVTP